MPTQDPQYLIGRHRSRPGAIAIHAKLHSIVPSGERMTAEQMDFVYPVIMRPRNTPVARARFILDDRRVIVDDGGTYIFELTDRAPAASKRKPVVAASPESVFNVQTSNDITGRAGTVFSTATLDPRAPWTFTSA